MDTNELSPREIIAERDSIRETAEFAYESARAICHIDIQSVPTVYAVTAEFYNAASAIGTASANMARSIDRIDASTLYETRAGRSVDQGIAEAVTALREAQRLATELNGALQTAQSAISGIGHRDEDGNPGL